MQVGTPPAALRDRLGEQSDWFLAALGELGADATIVRPFLGEALPAPPTVAVAVITGSWAMVTDREDWSERTAEWIRNAMAIDMPLLGVCYGHQLMADALGGRVDFHPAGREIGMQGVRLTDAALQDPLLGDLPTAFRAYLTHEQTVLEPPSGATVLGRSDHDPHQILRYGPNALSVQFHPEFTPHIMRVCLERNAERYASEGHDVAALIGKLEPGVHAHRILAGFVQHYMAVRGPSGTD